MKALFPLLICLLIACAENREAAGEGNGMYGYEQIATDAIFFDTIGGNELFEIHEGVLLTSIELENDWILGEFVLSIPQENYESAKLEAGDSLKNTWNEVLGLVHVDFPIWKTGKYDGEYVGVIRAYTKKQNLLPSSILERSLEMSLKSGPPRLDDLETFIVDHRLKFKEIFPGYQSYFQLENEMIKDFPGFRLILIFSGQNLEAIVHRRKLGLPSFELRNAQDGYYLSFPDDLEEGRKESFFQAFQKFRKE